MTAARSALPPPPEGRTGWPWTVPRVQSAPPAHRPRVSIITPSFNQARFLEATLRSVVLQDYPNLEYIVIDGGSTDGSQDIIQRYAPHLDYWVSEPDRGQAHAINKGFLRASGEILAWLNSDDYYTPDAIALAVEHFQAHPEVALLYGDGLVDSDIDGSHTPTPSQPWDLRTALRSPSPICQPATFFRRALLEQTGPLDESFRYAMDYDLWLRASKFTQPRYLPGATLAVVCDHPNAKSRRERGEVVFESVRAVERYYANPRVRPEAVALKRASLVHLYLECGASAVLTKRKPLAAIGWVLRALVQDPFVLALTPGMAVDFAREWANWRR